MWWTTQKLVDYETVLMKPAYVHISKESQEAISRYKSILKEKDIYSIGRYGSWTYCSIEDNILEAKEVALGILILDCLRRVNSSCLKFGGKY